jgi:hypothetical protein
MANLQQQQHKAQIAQCMRDANKMQEHLHRVATGYLAVQSCFHLYTALPVANALVVM